MNNGSLKVLHILDHSVPVHSGYAFRSQSILRAQLKRGWQPVALTSPKHEENWEGSTERQEEIDGLRYYRAGAISQSMCPIIGETRLMMALGRRIQEIVDLEKPDLLHAHSPVLNVIPAIWIGRKLGMPIVYEIRAFWEDAAVDHGTYGQDSWNYRLIRSAETWACQRANEVAVLCHGLKEDLVKRRIPSGKLTVVPNGVNEEDFVACEPDIEYMKTWKLDGKKVIGFIGSFYRYEGLDLLIDVMARLSATRSDIVLLLVGGGEMEREIKERIEELDLGEKVVMPGRIPHNRIPHIYAFIDILVYPRCSIRLTELVTPLKPLEAMAMGRALIASDIGGHRELIQNGQTGLLFQAGNISALAEAIEHLLDDDGFRRRLAQQAFTWVRQEKSWDKIVADYSDIYSRAWEGSRRRAER